MFKFVVLALLAVAFSGSRAQQDHAETGVAEDGVPNQYRKEVEDYIGYPLPPLKCWLYEEKNVKFYLYTNQVPDKVELKPDNMQYLANSSYDVTRDVEIIVHDWLFSVNSTQELVSAYLRHSLKPVNVIQVDYSFYSQCQANDFMHPRIYNGIAITVAKLLKQLHNYDVSTHMMHVIGFGAGAHIAGAAAKQMRPLQVARITGLDPVGFKFDEDANLPQLEATDADFVDVIVTNAGQIGSTKVKGWATFYPNGGSTQPNSLVKQTMVNSHVLSMFYMVESIARGKVFKAYVGNSWADHQLGLTKNNEYSYMGEYAAKNVTGTLYLEVNRFPPYGQDEDKHTHKQQIANENGNYPNTYLSLILPNSRSAVQMQQYQEFAAPKEYRQFRGVM